MTHKYFKKGCPQCGTAFSNLIIGSLQIHDEYMGQTHLPAFCKKCGFDYSYVLNLAGLTSPTTGYQPKVRLIKEPFRERK